MPIFSDSLCCLWKSFVLNCWIHNVDIKKVLAELSWDKMSGKKLKVESTEDEIQTVQVTGQWVEMCPFKPYSYCRTMMMGKKLKRCLRLIWVQTLKARYFVHIKLLWFVELSAHVHSWTHQMIFRMMRKKCLWLCWRGLLWKSSLKRLRCVILLSLTLSSNPTLSLIVSAVVG